MGKICRAEVLLSDDSPAARWIEALFRENATIKLSPAQLQNLAASHKAWMRNLHVAGDAAFRIAFRLEAPALQKQPWQLHYLIQAKDDPSLLIPADEVWKKTKGALTHLGHRFEQPQEKLLAGSGLRGAIVPAHHRQPERQTSHRTGSGYGRRVHLSARDCAPARRRGLWHARPALVEQERRAAGRQSQDEIQTGARTLPEAK